MPPAKRTTSTAKSTETAKVDADKVETTKAAEATKADPKPDDSKPAVEVERNPELDGNVDKVAEADRTAPVSDETEKFQEEQERKREKLLKEGAPTSEAYDDPHVNLADLPVHHDPVVTSDHAQASAAASVPVSKITKGTPVQVSQMDTSDFSGGSIIDSLSHRVVAKDDDKDDKDSDKK